MGQVRLLKVGTTGIPTEFADADEVTMTSFSITGSGPSLSATGLFLNDQDIDQVADIIFDAPSANTINQTAGNLIIDNIMAKERQNVMTTAGEVLFPVVTNTAGQLDNFRLPAVAGAPTATPTNGGEGFMVWDSTNDDLYVWNGTSWDSQSIVEDANDIMNPFTAGEAVSAAQAVYISAADTVMLADNTTLTKAQLIGFTDAAAASGATVNVVSDGPAQGFSGLTPGARYYLDATAGAITSTIPTGSGSVIVQGGYGKTSTELFVQIQSLGRRA